MTTTLEEIHRDPAILDRAGETGSGKSIIVGALQLILGVRADLSRTKD